MLVHSSDSNLDSCFLSLQPLFFLLINLILEDSTWHCWLSWAAACQAPRDINWLLNAWNIGCQFSPYFVFPRQKTQLDTHVRTERIVLHLVCYATGATRARRFWDWQDGVEILGGEYFGCSAVSALCLIISEVPIAVIMYAIKPNNSKKTKAWLFPNEEDKGFREAVYEELEVVGLKL